MSTDPERIPSKTRSKGLLKSKALRSEGLLRNTTRSKGRLHNKSGVIGKWAQIYAGSKKTPHRLYRIDRGTTRVIVTTRDPSTVKDTCFTEIQSQE